jgi:Domain of unknown function (DUF1877)
MSMIGNFRSVSDDDIDALLERPTRIHRLLYDDEGSTSEGLVRRLVRGRQAPDEWRPSGGGEELDIDKAWQGIHFLLTQTDFEGDPPLNFILQGGRWVGDVDVGYGPARALTSEEVREIAAAMQPITPDMLRERFDPPTMMKLGIYPEIWDRDPADDDTLGYLIEYFDDLRAFVERTAERREGMLVYLS